MTDGKLWCMERLVFQQIMQSTGIKKTENQVRLLDPYWSMDWCFNCNL